MNGNRAKEASFIHNGKPFRPAEGLFEAGTLIGLNCGEETVALGIMEEITATYVVFRSPIASLREINTILFGDITC